VRVIGATDLTKYTVVITHLGEQARLDCATLEEAQLVRQSFVNYGQYQEVDIEVDTCPEGQYNT
jgi:hypothetical protein